LNNITVQFITIIHLSYYMAITFHVNANDIVEGSTGRP